MNVKKISLAIVTISKFSGAFFALLISLFLMQFLEKSELIDYVIKFASLTFVSSILSVGIDKNFVFEYTKNNSSKELSTFVFDKLILCSIFLLITIFYGLIIGHDIYIYAGLFLVFHETNLVLYQSKKQYLLYSLFNITKNVFIIISLVLLYYLDLLSVNNIGYVYLYVGVFYFLFFLLRIRGVRFLYVGIESIFKRLKWYYRFAVYELSKQIFSRMEVWLLAIYLSYEFIDVDQGASYSAALNLSKFIPIIISSLTVLIFPEISSKKIDSRSDKKYIGVIFLISFPLIILVAFFSGFIYPQFSELRVSFVIISIALLFSAMCDYFNLSCISQGLLEKSNKVYVVQSLLCPILSLIFVYFFGFYGLLFSYVLIRFLGLFGTFSLARLI
ncbi:hypothetical protein J0673_09115 [Vibrio sp. Vb2736]|uniref:hypothetical protein n=1 Tax=Vibrio sp. Vb2736 TaxID=2816075 RepID=UPI001A90BB86|nr:hypothetical protein [Vibrio sp. Vb2736]MBO0136459.1 hypothetical protein [Vibrio sp. Vb2736]